MAKVRFQMFLDTDQKRALENIQKDTNIPVAEVIRRAIDRFVDEWKKNRKLPVEYESTDKLLSITGVCEGGPKDLADKHDRYLYGTPGK